AATRSPKATPSPRSQRIEAVTPSVQPAARRWSHGTPLLSAAGGRGCVSASIIRLRANFRERKTWVNLHAGMSVFRPALAILAMLTSSAAARAGTLRGQLTLAAERADSGTDGLWRIDNGILPVLPRTIDPRSECVIVLVPKVEPKR